MEITLNLPTTRYAVLFLDVLTANVEILQVFKTTKDALEYLHLIIDANVEFQDPSYFKKYNDSISQVSVYRANWIAPKSLIGRYFICKYEQDD